MVNVEGSLSADLIAQQNFSPARRGFDPEEVRSFLVKVAAEIVALHERQSALEDARRDAEYRAAHPSFDEETLFGAVGEETAHILKSAHEASADIKNRAGENASRILKEAHQQAEAMRAEAETVLARRTEEAEAVAGRIKEAAKAEAERLLDQTRQQAKAMRAQAEAERNAMIEGAQATREKILSTLSKKRNVAVAQVEALRAGRERLIEAYEVVRRTLDEATVELARAETEARAAADAVRHRPLALDEADGLDDEGDPPTNPTLPIIQKRMHPTMARPSPAVSPAPAEGPRQPTPPAAAPQVMAAAPPVVAPAGDASPLAAPAAGPSPSSGPGSGESPPAVAKTAAPLATPPGGGASAPVVAGTGPSPTSAAGGGTSQSAVAASPSLLSGAGGGTSQSAVAAGPSLLSGAGGGTSQSAVAAAAPPLAAAGAESPTALNPEKGPFSPPPPTSATPPEPPTAPAAGNVDSLFARIRADRDKAVAHARELLAEGHPVADEDEALLQRRDAVIEPIEVGLSRRLKRALQDDQNDLLDRLRNIRASQKAAAVILPSREAHAARFRDVARPFLGEAISAGTAFTASVIPGQKVSEHHGGVELAAEDLAEAIIEPLRRRLESLLVAGQGDDPVVLAEAVGAAYREWKAKRIEVVTADHVAAAFANGAYSATPAGATLRWVVEDVDGPCPDCDDNVLAGGQPKGEPFPTGQRHPPAHPGCRCFLVPQMG